MEGSVVPTYPSIHQTEPCCFWSSGYCRRATCSTVRDKLILHPEQCHKRKSIYEGSPRRVRGRCNICQKKKKKLVVNVQQFFIHKGCNGVITQMVCAERDVSSQIPSTNKNLPGQMFLVTFVGSFFQMLVEVQLWTIHSSTVIICKTWRGLARYIPHGVQLHMIWRTIKDGQKICVGHDLCQK